MPRNVVIIRHTYTISGLVEEELLNYIKNKSKLVTYITHPYKSASENKVPLNTTVKIFKNAHFLKIIKGPSAIGPEMIFFIKDLLFNIFYLLFKKEKIDIFIGVDNLNALSGIILKLLGKVDKVAYYVIDYVPLRFKNPVLNEIYHLIDFFCVKNADQTWNLSSEMARERIKNGLEEKYLSKQITVPVGCYPLSNKNNNKNTKKIIYLGVLNESQGIKLFIESLPLIIKRLRDIKVIIIGWGELEIYLRRKILEPNIKPYVEFKGYIKSNKEVNRILRSCSLGVAPYIISEKSYKYYTDPGKIKTYLGAGLPVVMTNISHIAKVIENNKAGIIVKDQSDSIAKGVIDVLSDKNYYLKLRRNAISLSKEYSWENIYKKAFLELAKV